MSFKRLLSKKNLIVSFVLIAFLALGLLYLYSSTSDAAKFSRLSKELFQDELAGNALSLHYTLAYPEAYQLEDTIFLPIYTGPADPGREREELLAAMTALTDIEESRLSAEDAYAYRLLKRYLEQQLKGTDFTYYSEPFSPGSGIQSGLPILLADYTFRRKKDIEDYLSILEQTEGYLNGLLTYEKEKADAGFFMSDASAEKVIKQCCAIMDKEALASGTHFLHTTFSERLAPLMESDEITEQEAMLYLSENDRLLTCVMAPAYEQIADTFTVLSGMGKNSGGLAGFEKGKSYYTYLLASATGSSRSVAEIKRLLFADFENNYNALLTLLTENPFLAEEDVISKLDLTLDVPADMITNLKEQMRKDFPAFPAAKDFHAGLTLKKVSASMEDYCSPAYYLTPPLDDMSENIIYINGKNQTDNLGLYTTLAHEGYPGHLYQTVYSQLAFHRQNTPLIRYLLHYGGYVEGWAYYVEDLSYKYAGNIAENQKAAVYYEACRLNRNLHLCLYSLIDIAIHYDGANLSQIQRLLRTIGVTDSNAASHIYRYIVEEPANYPKYYLGYLEMTALKAKAQKHWGNAYSDYRFHTFVLSAGPSDFIGLQEKLLTE